MAIKRSQRYFIWFIAFLMLIGTIGGFIAIILAPKNEKADTERYNKLYADYQKDLSEFNIKLEEQASKLSDQYIEKFKELKSRVGSFERPTGKDVIKNDIEVGNGDELGENSRYGIYYIGWRPDGEIFDSSLKEGTEKLSRPLVHETRESWDFGGQSGNVISGWTEGIVGMKMNGIRELTIPPDKAYGEAGSGDSIPGNTPLKFIIMVIDPPEKLAQPEIPEELYPVLNN